MKLKTAKYILLSACALMAVLLLAGSAAQSPLLILLGGVIALAGAIFWIIFGRCPNCGKVLGRTDGKHCPHCGAEIKG